MKLLITGASGFVGREIIPHLIAAKHDVLLLGRDADRLVQLYPTQRVASYDSLDFLVHQDDTVPSQADAEVFDVLIHLAVANNDKAHSVDQFRTVNVDFSLRMADLAVRLGARRFINLTTFHAESRTAIQGYAQSKREGEAALSARDDIIVTHLRLPAVYGRNHTGRMTFLNRLPRALQEPARNVLALSKPIVSARRVAEAINQTLAYSEPNGDEKLVTDRQEGNSFYRIAHNVIDYGFAFLAAVFLSWLIVIFAMLIRRDSPGSAIFVQQRVGRNGRLFDCYKLRTMAQGTPQAGTHHVSAASVTKIGHFLRRTKLDELPQIWNILRGEISLVGPRPCLPVQTELVEERRRREVLTIKPGITGLAQVQGVDMSNPARLARLDQEYLAKRTLLLDLWILLATATGKGQGDRVT